MQIRRKQASESKKDRVVQFSADCCQGKILILIRIRNMPFLFSYATFTQQKYAALNLNKTALFLIKGYMYLLERVSEKIGYINHRNFFLH